MRRFAALVLASCLLAAACGNDDDDDAASTTSSTASTTTTTSPESTSTTGGDADPVGDPSTEQVRSPDFPGENETALLTDVRLASHDGFDRIVFEFDGGGQPSFQVGYVEPPVREDGSGNEVDVDGSAFLEIRMAAASGVDLSGDTPEQTYTGPRRIDGPGSPVVELVRTGDFEAVLTWVAGIDGEQPFAVTRLASPTRVVVDVLSGG